MKKIEIYFKRFIDYCRVQKRLSHDTVKAYELDLKMFAEFLSGLPAPIIIEDSLGVTKQTLEEYARYLNENFAVKTVRRRIASLRSFFTYLEYQEMNENNPFDRFRLNVKEPFRLPQVMSLEDIKAVLISAYGAAPAPLPGSESRSKAVRRGKVNPNSEAFLWARDVAILELLFAGGLRVSELCKLEFEDLSTDYHTVRINGKGNKERTIYLGNVEVVEALNRYLMFRKAVDVDSPSIFITKFHKPLTTQAVRNLVEKYAKLAGISKKITPHVFRHSFASLLLEEGVDIKYIQDFLGHSSISTTQIYLHTTSSQKRLILSTKHPRQKLVLSDIAQTVDFSIK